MKKRINLFSKKKQQNPIPVNAIKLRKYGMLFSVICFVLVAASGFYYYTLYQQQQSINAEVANLKASMNTNDKIQGNIVYFVNKKDQLKEFLKDDSQFPAYYRLLQDLVVKSKSGASLDYMSLNMERVSTFAIVFSEFETSEQLLNFIESKEFLDNFTSLTLSNFSVGQEIDSRGMFTLQFQGTFKTLDQIKKEQDES